MHEEIKYKGHDCSKIWKPKITKSSYFGSSAIRLVLGRRGAKDHVFVQILIILFVCSIEFEQKSKIKESMFPCFCFWRSQINLLKLTSKIIKSKTLKETYFKDETNTNIQTQEGNHYKKICELLRPLSQLIRSKFLAKKFS